MKLLARSGYLRFVLVPMKKHYTHWQFTARELICLSGMLFFLGAAAWLAREVSIYRTMMDNTTRQLSPPFTNAVIVNNNTNYAPKLIHLHAMRLDSPHNLR